MSRARLGKSAALALVLATGSAGGDQWPQWRGPQGTGVAPDSAPTRWSAADLTWKARLGGLGISSPVVWNDRVFVTSQTGRVPLRSGNHPTLNSGKEAEGEKPLGAVAAAADSGKVRFLVEAFHRKDGRRLWQYAFDAEGELAEVHQKHNLASPSPVTDGRYVYAWFGSGQLVALDLEGKLAWKRHLAKDYGPFDIAWGHGSSPTLYRDLVILLCDHSPASYLVALDKRTGAVRWRTEREKGSISYSTPTVVPSATGDELVVNSTRRVDAYDPATGKLLWWVGDPVRFAIPVPAFADGVLYLSRGYRSGPYMSIRTGGRGDVAKTQVGWSVETGAPYISSLLYYRGLVYMASDVGVVTAVDASTGAKVWQERVEGIFTASPVAADGKVYFVSETGETIVLQAGRPPSVLARNSVGERSAATPAISDGQIFIRTDDHIICVGRKA
jgi:outer membrane protein assembly factor BamB